MRRLRFLPIPGLSTSCRLAPTLRACSRIGAALLLVACQPSIPSQDVVVMFDCDFARNGPIHVHVADQLSNASLITAYQPAGTASHAEVLRNARESRGRIVKPGTARYLVEMFLLNDDFGQGPDESLLFRLAHDGRALLEGSSSVGQRRVVDVGSCRPSGTPAP